MTLLLATLITAGLCLIAGVIFLFLGPNLREPALKALRNRPLDIILALAATAWFLWHIQNLGVADFGRFKHVLTMAFGLLAVLSIFYVPDFLGVRASAVLYLLLASELLGAAFMEEPATRLFMVSLLYVGIVAALYLGTVPFRARDLINWLTDKALRARIAGLTCLVYGGVLIAVAVTYPR